MNKPIPLYTDDPEFDGVVQDGHATAVPFDPTSLISISAIEQIIEHYRQTSGDPESLQLILQIRQHLAVQWLTTSTDQLEGMYLGEIGAVHQLLNAYGFNEAPLSEVDLLTVQALSERLTAGITMPVLLAAMLYRRADQLLLTPEFTEIPAWFLTSFFKFIFGVPSLFQNIGEADTYYQYFYKWISYIHSNILSHPNSEVWNEIVLTFIQNSNLIPVYFNLQNLKEIYVKRAEIIEIYLRHGDRSIDHEFFPRDVKSTKIRVGILKGHFNPQTETFLTIPAFEYLDREQFEVFLYTLFSSGDPLEQYCRDRADRLVYLPSDLNQQVDLMRSEDLDVLLFGTNTTAVINNICLLACYRLARVQATLYSSPITTGFRNMDYYISGTLTEPAQQAQDHYSEKLVTLEGIGYCFNYGAEPHVSEPRPTRASLGIAKDAVVYISGANFFKVIPEVRVVWTNIIAAVPNSVLVLYPFSSSWSNSYEAKAFTASWYALFDNAGIDRSRLILLPSIPLRADVKAHLALADIYLDSIPYTGSLSVSDALEVGVPPVVVDGNTLRSRQGPALLRDFEMPELIAKSTEDYVRLAIDLGMNSDLRRQKHEHILNKMQHNPGFLDSQSYSAQIGSLLQSFCQTYQSEQIQRLHLKQTNYIAFPDWTQSEDVLSSALFELFRFMLTQPNGDQTTLLVYIGDHDDEQVNMTLASVAMYLMMEEGLEATDESMETVLLTDRQADWSALLPCVTARLELPADDQAAIAYSGANRLPVYTSDSLPQVQLV